MATLPSMRRVMLLVVLAAAAWGLRELLRPRDVEELAAEEVAWDRWDPPEAEASGSPRLRGRGDARRRTTLLREAIAAVEGWWREAHRPDSRRAIAVEVVGEGDGAPIAGADVWVAGGDPEGPLDRRDPVTEGPSAKTDAAGRAVLRTERRGWVVVLAQSQGRLSRTARVGAEDGVRIALGRGLRVSGRVSWADGRPATGARVRTATPFGGSGFVTADDEGGFVLAGLGPGHVLVEAAAMGDAGVHEARRWAVAGEEVALALDAIPSRRLLTVVVRDPEGRPVPGASVAGAPGPAGTTDAEGRWQGVPAAGLEALAVTPPRQRQDLAWALVPLATAPPTAEVTLPPSASLRGHVRDADGRGLARRSVSAVPREPGDTAPSWRTSLRSHARTDGDGAFAFRGVPAGDVWVLADGTGAAPVAATAPADDLALLAPSAPTLRVEGRVCDESDRPNPGAVVWWAVPGPPEAWSRAPVLEDGTVHLVVGGASELRVRCGSRLEGPRALASSERTFRSSEEGVRWTVPRGPDLEVVVEDWPAGEAPCPACLAATDGAQPPSARAWVTDGTARFLDLGPRRRAAVYVGPLPDGRVGWVPEVATDAGRVGVRLGPGRTVRGRVAVPEGWRPAWVALAARPWPLAVVGPDGTFALNGVPRAEVALRATVRRPTGPPRVEVADLVLAADRDEVDWTVEPGPPPEGG